MGVLRTGRRGLWNDEERRLRTPWRLLAGVAAFAGGTLVASILVTTVLGLAGFEPDGLEGFAAVAASTLVVELAVVGILWPLARFVDRRRLADYGLGFDRRWGVDLAFGLALGAVLQTAAFLVGWLAGWFRVTGTLVADGSFLRGIGALAVLFLAVGIYEELLARGWLLTNLAEGFRFLGERVAVGLSVLLSSVVFGAIHLPNPGASLLSAATVTLAGVFLALGYVLTGELGLPIGVHISWNFFQGPVFGLGVSGLDVPASVIAVDPVGPAWLTGGAFGPEAGALGVGAVGLGIAATGCWARRREGRIAIHPGIATPALRETGSVDDGGESTRAASAHETDGDVEDE